MNPLQYFLLTWYSHEPGHVSVPLATLLRAYNNLLPGDEHPRWRDRAYVSGLLARAFPILDLNGQKMVGNIRPKRMAGSPQFMGLLDDLEVAA